MSMKEINDKDLEKSTGGVRFSQPWGNDDTEYGGIKMPVDLNHCCEHFERAMYSIGSQSGCVNCWYLLRDMNGRYYCRGFVCDRHTGQYVWEGLA